METINNTIFFDSEEELADFCIAPFAVLKQTAGGHYYVEGDYSEEYKKSLSEGKTLVVKDEDAPVYRRDGIVSKRVPAEGTSRSMMVQLKVENLKPYYERHAKKEGQ